MSRVLDLLTEEEKKARNRLLEVQGAVRVAEAELKAIDQEVRKLFNDRMLLKEEIARRQWKVAVRKARKKREPWVNPGDEWPRTMPPEWWQQGLVKTTTHFDTANPGYYQDALGRFYFINQDYVVLDLKK